MSKEIRTLLLLRELYFAKKQIPAKPSIEYFIPSLSQLVAAAALVVDVGGVFEKCVFSALVSSTKMEKNNEDGEIEL